MKKLSRWQKRCIERGYKVKGYYPYYETLSDSQEIIVESENQMVRFTAADILHVYVLRPEMITVFKVPRCAERDNKYLGCPDAEDGLLDMDTCMHCPIAHEEEAYLDGWPVYVGELIAELNTGVRVPIDDKVRQSYLKGFRKAEYQYEEPYVIEV